MDAPTLAYYNCNAAEVARRYESADAALIHANLLDAFSQDGELLEMGVGSGRDAAFLLARGYRISATDASPEMIAEATRLHPELGGRLILHTFPDPLPFPDHAFDGAYAIALLMHLPKESILPSLLEIARVLRPGGRLLFSVPNLRTGPALNALETDPRLFTKLEPTEWEEVATRAGFKLTKRSLDQDGLTRSGFSWHTFLFTRETPPSPPGI
jgi:SAM-dependent methyltransferase